jgi:hypothetical protein
MPQPGYREIPGMFDGRILPVTLRVGLPILIGHVLRELERGRQYAGGARGG